MKTIVKKQREERDKLEEQEQKRKLNFYLMQNVLVLKLLFYMILT